MSRRGLAIFLAAILIGAASPAASPAPPDAPAPRPLKIDDLFEIEGLGMYYGGPYAFSPDGKALAFTRKRAKKTLKNHKWEYLWGNAAGDVWLQRAPGEPPVNLTNGVSDGSGWFSPQWSPDGKFLAMLSTRGGNVGLWVWEASGKGQSLRKLTDRGVDLVNVRERPYLWIDSRRILCPVLPEGEQPLSMKIELETPQIATREWAKTPVGQEPTASVLDSGVPVDLSKRKQGRLLVIDAAAGASEVVADYNTDAWQLSPGGRMLAFCRQVGIYTPRADEPLRFATAGTYSVEIHRIGGGGALKTDRPLPKDVLKDSLRWSPDGAEVAFLAFGENRGNAPRLYRVAAESGRVSEIDLGELDAEPAIRLMPQLEWTAAGDLLFLAARREKGDRPGPTARRDWWIVTRDGKTRCLTEGMSAPPPELWPQDGRAAFVGLAGGPQATYGKPARAAGADDVWRIRAEAPPENLTARFDPAVAQIAWPRLTNNGDDEYPYTGRTYSKIALGVSKGQTQDFFVLDLVSGEIRPLAKPSDDADLKVYDPRGSAIFAAGGKNGTFVWRSGGAAGKAETLVAANTFLRDIAEAEAKPIEYVSLNGEKLNGWILLPVGYQAGKRYPVITWVYAGYMYRPQRPWIANVAEASPLSMQIPAAHGYAILLPSMPLKPEGETEDPMLRLTEGVMPALDKAVELGIADPDRLFVMGQSFGGFSTYGLVTQTTRFKAAVSLAGLSDFISLYGQFDARSRYTDSPQENLFMAALMESAQTGMGNPPWKDLGRYLRNSPIFTVDRVKTPLLIIQGDLDYVAVQQGEEFFVSLYRQAKRARFVRYWGEGHVLESPANIRDMWRQIDDWLDEFGDIARDASGGLVFDGDRVKSRKPQTPKPTGGTK
ncbi:MAG TPA: prolyl oligopeptidase family serine peptidase [Thermoanaerobaculia bacterium]|nr:prolyl oligopeptidase family serine peptidase [Thermoanaerobaculia bacterium]